MTNVGILMIGLTGLVTSLAAEPTQIKFETEYADMDPKWFSDISPYVQENLATKDKDGPIKLPSVITKSGIPAKIEVIREFSARLPSNKTKWELNADPASDPTLTKCGIISDLTPYWNDGKLTVTGKHTLRRALDKTPEGTATQFASKETLIDTTLEHGKETSIDLGDGGELRITATLITNTGRPWNPEANHDN